MLYALFPVAKNFHRTSKYIEHEDKLDFTGISYPISPPVLLCTPTLRNLLPTSPSTRGQLVGRVGAADRARGVCGCRISKCKFYKHTMLVGAAQALAADTFTLSGQEWVLSSGDEH